uniref:FXYD domain-containing ion transport regulator n=1 Tax=Heterorhabditis bacteriophora TaxID=37862 RepID=A0A1I7XHU1_HETBA
MAAVRAGAVGISRSPRFTMYSSRVTELLTVLFLLIYVEQIHKFELVSDVLRLLTLILTVLLLLALIVYHSIDTKIYLIETGSDHWRIGVTRERVARMSLELAICAVCPLPG